MAHVELKAIINKMGLTNLSEEIDTSKVIVTHPEINRPALQLAGFFEHFDHERIQIIGNVEYVYMDKMSKELREERLDHLFSFKFPCLIIARGLKPHAEVLKAAKKYEVPVLISDKVTSDIVAEVIRWLKVQLAPTITIHGVLVDVFGEGVLITGESGIGKSEAALELIKRGHRLVSDDAVMIKKVSDDTLVGTAPEITRHFIELRGIGIINVKTLFGVASVKDTQNIDIVIVLEDWSKDKEYDRMGTEENYTEYLGNKVACFNIPIRPGRNLAVIVESAAINHREKKMGYNAAQELYDRVQKKLAEARDNDGSQE